jgi:exosortase A-associated hydrolase 2
VSANAPLTLETTYLRGERGRLFSLYTGPSDRSPIAGLLFAPAFADEQNKSRHLVSAQARGLARAGVATLVLDLFGTGDSEGELVDASWDGWLDDLDRALQHLRSRVADAPVRLWGVRAGALLAAELANRIHADGSRGDGPPPGLLFWSPVLKGQRVLNDLFRLKAASSMRADAGVSSASDARQLLAKQGHLDVAGHRVPAEVADGLARANLVDDLPAGADLLWLDVVRNAARGPTPAVGAALSRLTQSGSRVEHRLLQGPAFWASVELEWSQDLLDETQRALCSEWT